MRDREKGRSQVVGSFLKLSSIDVGQVCWTEGFWGAKFDLCRKVMLSSMRRALDVPENGAVFRNFYVAAGLVEGDHLGTDWSDGDCYKWMEAVSHVYGVTRDPVLDQTLDELIEVIAQAQDDDGYICTQTQLNLAKDRWQVRRYHELYNMGHLMTAACVHHRVTGKESFLQVAVKLADHLYQVFSPRSSHLAAFGWNPSNIMGLVDLYRTTGEPRHLELADIFVTMRGSHPWPLTPFGTPAHDDPNPGDQNQNRVPFRNESYAVGHAVTATYLYCGVSDVYAETGEQALWDALERVWHDVVEKKMYLTGGVCPLHQGVSMRGDPVHEAFDLPYHLHNASAYNETCANIGNAMWNWRMLNLTADAKYADVMEQVIYNSGLSGVSIDGKRFCYTNPLRWHGARHERLSHDTPERWFTHNCYCCPPQVVRTIAGMHNWAYSRSPEGIWVHLYGGSRLETELTDGLTVALDQETDYPWDGSIRITLERVPGTAFALMLRIPLWVCVPSLRINGEPVSVALEPGSYVSLERRWAAGDVVELELPMPARLVGAHPKVEEARNQAAVMRGPVVYCIESVDLPQDLAMSGIHLARDTRFQARYDADLLGGVVVLEGKGRYLDTEIQGGALYGGLEGKTAETVSLRMIPYYAWNNRGETEMTVWLPLY